MDKFKTPTKSCSSRSFPCQTPIRIPESPQMETLGWGTGVKVYSMQRSPRIGCYRSPWAIKKINSKCSGNKEFGNRLKEEATILRKLNHPNIVGFRAFVKSEAGQECLAMEKCETSLGSLIEERLENEDGPYPPNIIAKVGFELAKGLDFLHRECKLLHGDIKSWNVLIKGDFELVKLCDFGVTLPLRDNGEWDESSSKPGSCYVGTELWSAPEVFNFEKMKVTNKADIFAYGLIIWEMIVLCPPHLQNCNNSLQETNEDEQEYRPLVGTRPPLPDSLSEDYCIVVALFVNCTEEDFSLRPSAQEIVLYFNNLSSSNN